MDQYCVVLCGLQAGASDDTAAWQPVAVALKLDHAEFERRVVAALPRIVRQDLDQATAERIAQVLQALQVDARVLPHDPQLAYIERAGASCGPLPRSSLGDFIRPGEAYRLRGTTTWQPWPGRAGPQSVAATVGFGAVDDATPSASTGDETVNGVPSPPASVADEISEPLARESPRWADDEPEHATPASSSAAASDQRSDIAQDEAAAAGGEPPRPLPPPLRSASAAQPSSTPASFGEATATAPEPDVAASTPDDNLVEPLRETLPTGVPEAADPATSEVAEAAAPQRSRTGRLVMLVVLVALAVWAYRHWTASTHVAAPPAAVSAIQPPGVGRGPSTPSAHVVPGDAPTPPLASPASVAVATPTPAPAAVASAPATAGSTPAATATTAMPPAAAPTSAPATSTAAAATSSPNTLPASAGTVIFARLLPAVAASTAVPATPAH